MERALETLRNGDIELNAASLHDPLRKCMFMKRHLDGNNYFAVENIQVIADGILVNRFEAKRATV
jgi:hypothetical protein